MSFDSHIPTFEPQITDTFVMVEPNYFGFNAETAQTNVFQYDLEATGLSKEAIRDCALSEFDEMVAKLRSNNIRVLTLASPENTIVKDAVFPNNWFSHHHDTATHNERREGGLLILYPMLDISRRAERQKDALVNALIKERLSVRILDISLSENDGLILEGTGSMVLARSQKIAFAMESERTSRQAFVSFCKRMGYKPVFFHAEFPDKNGKPTPIYHTNVVMSIGNDFAVICLESIPSEDERTYVEAMIRECGKEIIPISLKQLGDFCGNILHVRSTTEQSYIVLSNRAFNAFLPGQLKQLERFGTLLQVYIPTIESGGGSARCMMAEIFPYDPS